MLAGALLACAPATAASLRAIQATATHAAPPKVRPASTASPAHDVPQDVRLTTGDGAQLAARQWGAGPDWVILSSNGDGGSDRWQPLAGALARRGWAVLIYDWRGTNPAVAGALDWKRALDDTRAALQHARARGANRLLLAGGSLGGITSIKLGAEPDVAGVIAISAPYSARPLDIATAEIRAIAAPILFVGSTADAVVPLRETQWLRDQSGATAEMLVFPGPAHGVDLLASPQRDALIQHVLNFAAQVFAPGDTPRLLRWRADLDALDSALRKGHPKYFYKGSQPEYETALAALRKNLPRLNDSEIKAAMMHLAAMADGHTRIFFGQAALGFHIYGLRLYKFADGLFVIDAQTRETPPIGAKLLRIGRMDANEVFKRISAYVEHDNDAWLDFLVPTHLLVPELLQAAGVITDVAHPGFVFQTITGTLTLNPPVLAADDFRVWSTLYSLPARAEVRWLSRRGEAFWFEPLPADNALYVQYNQVRPRSAQEALYDFAKRLDAALTEHPGWRVIVDLRNNGGGDNTTFGPLLGWLQSPRVNQPGKLYVLLGRNTFSAAANFATRVEQTTQAVFVGEPMGGSPNLYGDIRTHTLPHSGIEVWVSARYWQMSTPGDRRVTITPSISAPLTSADWFAGRDAALAAALGR